MNEEIKNNLLLKAKKHISDIQGKILSTIAIKEKQNSTMAKDAVRSSVGDAIAQRKILAINQERVENLKQLYPSPYFNFCEFEVSGEAKILYFSKFSFREENIYSWITPAATLRFEKAGPASYARPDGKKQTGILKRKDQYMIVDGKMIFFATESIGKARELVYQEHFTKHKKGFILPEVVEQMEKAQDQVIRADFKGPFLISGPAGSGKTTLALHRIAYLLQSPETAEYFSPDSIFVLAQDVGTKEYFSHLLPDLGIQGVSIVTFDEWALTVLGLQGYSFVSNYEVGNAAQLSYEHMKLTALRNFKSLPPKSSLFSKLAEIYDLNGREHQALFAKQKQKKTLDRFDLTILLRDHLNITKEFAIAKEYYEETANGKYRKRKGSFPVRYNLAVIDEFQNYLPEQILLFKSCMNHRLDSVVYVGDLAQQTQLGTVRSWQNIGEKFNEERIVTLQKVYRNSKQILKYIKELGYDIVVPDEIKDGYPVSESTFSSIDEEIRYVKSKLISSENSTVGILSLDSSYLKEYATRFEGQKNIYFLDFRKAQGVEFDQVFIVGLNKRTFALSDFSPLISEDVKKIYKDLLYVALTRAMGELHILGKDKLSDCVKDIV